MAIKIYCDGSTRIQNKKGADNIGGFGYVVFDENEDIIDAFSQSVTNTTNNQMELFALYYAIARYGSKDTWNCPEIYTDSQYALHCATDWGRNWMVNGWRTANNKPVENIEIIYAIQNLLSTGNFNVNLNYCKGHDGILGNELADKLAKGELTPKEVLNGNFVL